MQKNFSFKQFNYSRHAIERAYERDIDLNDVEGVVEYGEKVAEYPNDKPHESFLFMRVIDKKPLHVCFARLSAEVCIVITVYEPDMLNFESDFKTRKKP